MLSRYHLGLYTLVNFAKLWSAAHFIDTHEDNLEIYIE
jgi:hypothetical protein